MQPFIKYIFCLYTLFILPVTQLEAEIIYFKSGESIDAMILSQTQSEILIRISTGTKRLQKSSLKRISYVSQTEAQKKAKREALRKKREAARLEKERIEKEQLAAAEKERLLQELQEKELAEKRKEAKERAERAAALRELVKNEMMEKPADEPISYWDFAWRSLIVPGWGHFTIDRPTMGSLYMGATVALLANVYQKTQVVHAGKIENHNSTRLNFLFALAPSAISSKQRIAYGYYANGQALTSYKKKVRQANYSLYLLQAFYGLQLLHIIYNGFAWEKGLLIVDGASETPLIHSIKPQMALVPEINGDGRLGGGVRAELSYYF